MRRVCLLLLYKNLDITRPQFMMDDNHAKRKIFDLWQKKIWTIALLRNKAVMAHDEKLASR